MNTLNKIERLAELLQIKEFSLSELITCSQLFRDLKLETFAIAIDLFVTRHIKEGLEQGEDVEIVNIIQTGVLYYQTYGLKNLQEKNEKPLFQTNRPTS